MGIDFFRPKILTDFSVFALGFKIIFMNSSRDIMGLPPNSFFSDFMIKLGQFIFRSKKSLKKSKSISEILGQY